MEPPKNMALAFHKKLDVRGAHPAPPQAEESDHRLELSVVFTSVEPTLVALRKAGGLASSLPARITLVVPQVVPYPLPLASPPVLVDFSERKFDVIARESPVETTVRVYLCRDRWELLKTLFPAGALVVVGGRKRWWPTAETRLARRLRRIGYEVVFVEME